MNIDRHDTYKQKLFEVLNNLKKYKNVLRPRSLRTYWFKLIIEVPFLFPEIDLKEGSKMLS